ncbi:2OG-Fe dioxygenase family protein [Verminephrobacter eiseniae]
MQAQSSTMTLKNPGNFIFLNDHQIRHGVTPVAHLNPVREGSRDTLIVMFTKI